MFVWTDKELNEEQSAVVKDDANILLVACPGSGKTRTLTYKVANELSKLDSHKKFVIAITYTNRAADEIKERIELLGVPTKQLWIGTIHSFCNEWILKPYSSLLDVLKFGYRIMDSNESENILNEFCSEYDNPRITHWDCGHYATTTGIVQKIQYGNKYNSVSEVLQNYFGYLEENKFISYELMLLYSHQLLDENPVIASTLSKLFEIILVDEYQDTKEIQYHIISKLWNSGQGATRALIVGDPNQTIYGGLGGYPIDISDLENLSGLKFKRLELEQNYRSSSSIVDYFDKYKTFENVVLASGKEKDYASIVSFNNQVHVDNLVKEMSRLLRHNVEELGIDPNEICILGPQWIHLAPISRSLMIEMPEYNFNGPGMAPFSRDLDNFWYKLSRIVLTEASPRMYLRRLRWANEVLGELEDSGFNIDNINHKIILRTCNAITIDEINGLKYLKSFFETFLEILNIDITTNNALSESFTSFFDSSQKRIDRIKNEGNDFIEHIDSFKKVFQQKDGTTISTIHGVKGAEFDTVIAFGLLQGYVPHFLDSGGDESANRLLYVIGSRARKNLHLISETGRRNRRGVLYTPTNVLARVNHTYDEV